MQKILVIAKQANLEEKLRIEEIGHEEGGERERIVLCRGKENQRVFVPLKTC